MMVQDTVVIGYDCLGCGTFVTADEASIVMETVGMQVCFRCVPACMKN